MAQRWDSNNSVRRIPLRSRHRPCCARSGVETLRSQRRRSSASRPARRRAGAGDRRSEGQTSKRHASGARDDSWTRWARLAPPARQCLTGPPPRRIFPITELTTPRKAAPAPDSWRFFVPIFRKHLHQLRPGVGEYNTLRGNQPALPFERCHLPATSISLMVN